MPDPIPAAPETSPPPAGPDGAPAPEPQAPPAPAAPQPQDPAADDGAESAPSSDDGGLSREDALAALSKARKDAAKYRTQVRELEPLAQAQRDAEEANKTEIERAVERANAAEQKLAAAELRAEILQLAAKYAIPETHCRYIVGETPDERGEAAAGIGQMLAVAQPGAPAAPPSDRALEAGRLAAASGGPFGGVPRVLDSRARQRIGGTHGQ